LFLLAFMVFFSAFLFIRFLASVKHVNKNT
jgi:hypothetical protein